MAKNETRNIALQFVTNAEETKTKVDALAQSLDKTSSEYAQLQSESASLASAINDVNNAMENGSDSSNILQTSISKLEQETKKATSSLDTIASSTVKVKNETVSYNKETKSLTDSVTQNGGAMAILDSLTGGLATRFRDAREATALFTTANTASTGAMTGASVAAKALRVALATIGIGLIIAAVGYLVANWENLKKSFTDFLPTIGLTSETFDNLKAIVVGVGGAVVDFLIAPVKAFIKLVQGDFKGAVAEIGAGYNVVSNFNKAKNDQIERDNQAHRDKEFAEEVANDERNIQRIKNRGQNTDKLERDLLDKKTRYYKRDSEDYKKTVKDREDFEDRQIAERNRKAQADAQKRVERARETAEKLKQLEQERFEFDKKLQELRDAFFIKSAENPTDEDIKENEIKIRKLKEARDKELKDLKKLYKESSEEYRTYKEDINNLYNSQITDVENNSKELLDILKQANDLVIENLERPLTTTDSVVDYYERVIKFVEGLKSSDIKKYYEDSFNIDGIKESIKYINDLNKTWSDFDEQLRNNPDGEINSWLSFEDFDAVEGLLRKSLDNQIGALEEQKELNIAKLQELGLYEDSKLELEKYYANKTIELEEETAQKLEELEQKKRDAKIMTLDVTSNAVNSEMQLTDALLSFASEADQERIKASGAYKTRMIALTTIDMLSGAVSAYTSAMGSTGNPITDQILGISSAAAVVATGLANIKKIESVKLQGATGGGSGGVGGAQTAPNVQFVSSSENQIANSVNQNTNAQQDTPIKAYVVASDVTTAQSLEMNAIQSNSI